MKLIFISLAVGIGAAIVDIVPMIILKLDPIFVLSAGLFWIIMGVLVPRIVFTGVPWVDGIILGLLCLLPMISLIHKMDPSGLPKIIPTTIILGTAVGWILGLLTK